GTGILTGLSGTSSGAWTCLTSDYITDASFAIALANVLCLLVIETELVFVESFDGNFDGALAVREDDGFVRDDRSEVLADSFLYAILVALLIDDALALK